MHSLCIEELAQIIRGRTEFGSLPPLGGPMEPIRRVVADVRDVRPGDVFWATERGQHDGACRAEEAFRRGALGVVAARPVAPWAGTFTIVVQDPQWALWQLAAWSRRRFAGRVVAVTGDLGKSTTGAMIDAVLRARFDGIRAEPRTADRTELLLALLALDEGHDYGIFEYSASSVTEILALSHLCRPDIVAINCLADEPLSELDAAVVRGQLEAVAADGLAVLDGDIPRMRRWARTASSRVLLVGRSSHCELVARQVRSRPGELSFTVDQTRFRVPVWGRHLLHSALTAIAAGRVLGVPPEEIAGALRSFRAPSRRCEVIRCGGVVVIDDTCDSRAAGLLSALDVLREMHDVKRRVVVCGDLVGRENAFDLHRRAGHAVVQRCGADLLVACGRFGSQLVEGAHEAGMPPERTVWCRQSERLAATVERLAQRHDAVLVKGGRHAAMQQVIDALSRAPAAAHRPVAA